MSGRRDDASTPGWGLLDAVGGFLLALVGSSIVAGLMVGSGEATIVDKFVANIPLWLALGLVPIWATTTKGRGPVEDLGLRFAPIDLLIGAVAGTVLQLGIVNGVYLLLRPWISADDVESAAKQLLEGVSGWEWALILVMTLVFAPLVEELFYRGLVMRSLDRFMPPVASVLLSALAFGAMHFQLVQLLGLVIFGIACGALVQWTGRLGTSMVTHLVFNAWALWQIRGR